MKRFFKIIVCLLCLLITFACFSCDKKGNQNEGNKKQLSPIHPITYQGVNTITDYDSYLGEVRKNGNNNDDPVENGIVNCTYFDLEINGSKIPVYTTRAALGLHNFAYVDAEKVNGEILLDIKIEAKRNYKSVVVLPESKQVTATMSGNQITATVNDYGDYTFVFDKKPEDPLTVYVAPKTQVEVPNGWQERVIAPGKYTSKQTNFVDEQTVYVFKKGRYSLSSVHIPQNSHVYFEPGVIVDVYPESDSDYLAALRSGGSNVKVYGHALFDFSACLGGDAKIKGVYSFSNVSNFDLEGLITINSNNWTLCFTNSNNVNISRCLFFGYRTYSDGIMLSDCQNSGAKYCFVRTGDDAIETKSTGSMYTDGILYEYNTVWTDKANAYGAIYECNNHMQNVVFRNCSVGFAQPTWSERLGVMVVQMGNNREAVWEDIHFENIEVYRNDCALINITLRDEANNGVHGGTLKSVYFKNINSYRCYGYPFRLYVITGGSVGQVYLNNVYYNGNKIVEKDLKNSDVMNITNSMVGWSKEKNIIINSLDV